MSRGWAGTPRPLEVVWCRFPELYHPDGIAVAGPKPRPALVLEVDEHSTPVALHVAFGTSKATEDLYSGEFQIGPADGEVFKDSGCDEPTKFDLRRTVWLPFDDKWFALKPNNKSRSPVIGHIDIGKSAEVKRRLRAVVSMLAAEGLIAAAGKANTHAK